jgi:hypothetical protein
MSQITLPIRSVMALLLVATIRLTRQTLRVTPPSTRMIAPVV